MSGSDFIAFLGIAVYVSVILLATFWSLSFQEKTAWFLFIGAITSYLKIIEQIDWSWVWVLSPFWGAGLYSIGVAAVIAYGVINERVRAENEW